MNNLKKALNTNYLSIIGKRSILNKNKKDEELRLIEKGSTDNSFKLKNLEGTANGVGAISFGYKTKSEGNFTYSEGIETTSVGEASHSEGIGIEEFDIDILGNNTSYSYLLPAEVPETELVVGCGIKYNGIYAYITNISGNTITVSETLGNLTSYKSAKIFSGEAIGISSHSEGSYCNSIGMSSHSEGSYCNSKGVASHAEGSKTQAIGDTSHSEGDRTIAKGISAHAEGRLTEARTIAHAEGNATQAIGQASHTEGYNTAASTAKTYNDRNPGGITEGAAYAHAEGNASLAYGVASHAEGKKTFARNPSEHAQGQFNKSNYSSTTFGDVGNTIHSIGIGTSDSDRRNAVEVGQNGEIYIIGVGGYNGTNMNSGVNSLQKVLEDLGVTIDWSVLGHELAVEVPEE